MNVREKRREEKREEKTDAQLRSCLNHHCKPGVESLQIFTSTHSLSNLIYTNLREENGMKMR